MKKILLALSKVIIIVLFLVLNIGIFCGLYFVYNDNISTQEQIKIAQSECTDEKPLFVGTCAKEPCVSCDYQGAADIHIKSRNPCPNRIIVEDSCCGGLYSILPSKLEKWKISGDDKYCNPEMFCDPIPSTDRLYLNILGYVIFPIFYILLLFGFLWSLKKLNAKWVIPSIIASIILLVVSNAILLSM